jgi:DNA repair protein RadD
MSTLPLFDRPTLINQPLPSLRPYQQSAIARARAEIAVGKKRILLTAPTGSGKMVILSAIIRTSTVPVLFVAHRLELIDQCVDQLARQGVTNVGVLRGDDERENPSASVQVASIQTLARRKKPPAELVIVDEAHRACSDSYLEHVFDHYKDAIILGFTASPCRHDGKPLGALFEVLIQVATYSELFKRPDWLVAPDCYSAPVQADLSSIGKSHGDFEETALGEVMSQNLLVGNLLEHWLKLAGRHPVVARPALVENIPKSVRSHGDLIPGEFVEGERRRTFIFAVNIRHSQAICARFAAAGVRIAHLDGTTPEDERRRVLKALRAGELECVSNCNLFLEGVDAPEVKCVVMARPTWSLVLHLQSCGRIFRPWRGIRPLILDHAGNWDRHGPPHADRIWSLKNVAERRDQKLAPTKICRACFAYIPLSTWVCPYCKTVFKQEETVVPKETAETLVMRSDAPEVVRREFFDKMAILARAKGYKPGYASAKHKERYGAWPPYEWSEALKASFASDPQWQEDVAMRVQRKAEEDAAWEPEVEVEEPPAARETYEDGEETFAAWVERTVGR